MRFFNDLNPTLFGLIASFFTYFCTMLGASLVFFFKKVNKGILDFMMALSSGVMIAASFWSLLEPAITISNKIYKYPFIIPSLGFLFGGLFIVLCNVLLNKGYNINNEKRKRILLISSVTLHNIPEGMAIGVAIVSHNEISMIAIMLLIIGIGIQNIPEGACVSMPLRSNNMSRLKAFFIGQSTGIVEIGGCIIGVLFSSSINNMLPFFLSFSAGAMIVVVVTELIPDAFKNNVIIAPIGLLLGFVLMMVLDLSLG